MKMARYPEKIIIGLFCLSLGIFATQAHANGPGYMFCDAEYRSTSGEGAEGYVSTVFHVSSFYDDDVSESFEKFVEAEYAPKYAPYNYTCEYHLFDTRREAENARNEALSDWRDSGYKAYKVKWNY